MSKFRKKGKKSAPGVSTASLPDIVFMLLFFFMVTTTMREVDLKLEIKKPEASEIVKLENKSLVDYIYVGFPLSPEKYGNNPRIQLEDQIVNSTTDIGPWKKRRNLLRNEEDVLQVTNSLKVDEKVRMGIISKIKAELREIDALKINYSTGKKTEE
jgi:biopolymer transport protein ExbD